MSELAFYLQGTGDNQLTPDLLDAFFDQNPDLRQYRDKVHLELKTLDLSTFESFCAWIISQQISGIVAEKFLNRFRELLGTVSPSRVLEVDKNKLREIGLTRSKVEYLRNLAQFFVDQKQFSEHSNHSSSEIRDHYLQIKGIGDWTVNMFLIFSLGRLDIGAAKDLVVRKGMKKLYGLKDIPTINRAKNLMSSWNDLGTIGTILSWAVMGE